MFHVCSGISLLLGRRSTQSGIHQLTWASNHGRIGYDDGDKITPRYTTINHNKIRVAKVKRLTNNGNSTTHRCVAVHRLVWETWRGPIPTNQVVTFKDGDKNNTALANLKITTRSAIMINNRKTNLTVEENHQIVELWRTGKYAKSDLAKSFGRSDHCIYYVIKRWRLQQGVWAEPTNTELSV